MIFSHHQAIIKKQTISRKKSESLSSNTEEIREDADENNYVGRLPTRRANKEKLEKATSLKLRVSTVELNHMDTARTKLIIKIFITSYHITRFYLNCSNYF